MARKRKPGRPKGSKNRRKPGRPKGSTKRKAGKRKSKATPAQLRALKKAWAARRKQGKKARKKTSKKRSKKATAKQLANLAYARAVRADNKMPHTLRLPKLRGLTAADFAADTIRQPMSSMPSILLRVRRRPAMHTLVSSR